MAEAFVNVTEGSGKKLHAFDKTIGANTVLDEVMVNGEPYLATYAGGQALTGASIATANDHQLQIMAGASLNVYVRRILVYQSVLVTTAAIGQFEIRRLSTAGTGGTSLSVAALDTTDPAAGATMMALPTVKGTEGNRVWTGTAGLMQTAPTAGVSTQMFDIDFDKFLRGKALRIAAGTTNGIAFKNLAAYAGGSISVWAWISEANF